MTGEATLTASQTQVNILVTFIGAPDVLVVHVIEVDNPERQGVSLRATLEVEDLDGPRQFELGISTLFPPDLPASFALPFPMEAVDMLRDQSATQALVALEMVPVVAERPLREPLVVAVTAELSSAQVL